MTYGYCAYHEIECDYKGSCIDCPHNTSEHNFDCLPSIEMDNHVNLCDSCKYNYPDCPSGSKDVVFGNGEGNDNICACSKYKPVSQPETCDGCKNNGKWEDEVEYGYSSPCTTCKRRAMDNYER